MEITGTKEAFKRLLEVPALYKNLEVDTSTVANWKRYLREGKLISTDKMEEMLLKYGAKVKQEKVWIMDVENDSDKWVSASDRLPELEIDGKSSRQLLVKLRDYPGKKVSAFYSEGRWFAANTGEAKIEYIVTEWLDDPIEKR